MCYVASGTLAHHSFVLLDLTSMPIVKDCLLKTICQVSDIMTIGLLVLNLSTYVEDTAKCQVILYLPLVYQENMSVKCIPP